MRGVDVIEQKAIGGQSSITPGPGGTPGRPGVREIAKQFGVATNTVQRISRPFEVSAA